MRKLRLIVSTVILAAALSSPALAARKIPISEWPEGCIYCGPKGCICPNG